MKTNSPLFDRIRVKPDQDRRLRASEYWQFCLEHVREYNNSYNFFAGMSDDAVAQYQKDAITGHRPTWKLGSIGGQRAAKRGRAKSAASGWATEDPFSLFGETGAAGAGHARIAPEGRKIFNAQRRAFEALGLEADAKRADIKARFKTLVKRHHPDANGGDRGSEDRLREIIQAYNYLKSAGFC